MTAPDLTALSRADLEALVYHLQSARDADRRYARAYIAGLTNAFNYQLRLLAAANHAPKRGRRITKSHSITTTEDVDLDAMTPEQQIDWITEHPELVRANTK